MRYLRIFTILASIAFLVSCAQGNMCATDVSVQKTLAKQLISDVKRDPEHSSLSDEEARELVKSLNISLVDIDSDGVEEFFLTAWSPQWGGTGGYSSWVYKQTQNGYELIVQDILLEVAKEQTMGHKDIISQHPNTACCLRSIRYKFDGEKYKKYESCYKETSPEEITTTKCEKL